LAASVAPAAPPLGGLENLENQGNHTKTKKPKYMKTPPNNDTSSAQVPQSGTPIHSSTNPAIHQSARLFNQPGILEQIGHGRIAKFLTAFASELAVAGLSLPPALRSASGGGGSTDWSAEVAKLLASTKNLPEPLQHAMSTLEAAAAPENGDRLDALIQRHIPNVSLNRSCPLDCALELWFVSPQLLTQSSSSSSSSSSSPVPVPGSTVPGSGVAVSAAESVATTPQPGIALHVEDVLPWPEPVSGAALLDELSANLTRFVVLPPHASIALALWDVHTYAWQLRDVTTYIGIESPEKQCGKTTLLTVLNELVNRAVAAANVSPPAFFRVIQDLAPTLLIDEGDTFLRNNDQLRGIFNAGYKKKTAFVLRAGPAGPSVVEESAATPEAIGQVTRFSCWCPKVIATIGRLPDTLADRCILIRMQRKTSKEKCDRLREFVPLPLRQKCARFVLDHQRQIANAQPVLPAELSDRAAEIWEPLMAIADLAGDKWPEFARKAALSITTVAHESNPVASLLLDIFGVFIENKTDRMFSRILVDELNHRFLDRPWMYPLKGKPVTDLWLSHQLRPYGVRSRNMLLEGIQAKGYWLEEFKDSFRRYIPQSEIDALKPFNPPSTNT